MRTLAVLGVLAAACGVEYSDASLANTVCPTATALGFSTLIKNLELDAFRVTFP